ncbi:MAG: serine hydrolase [Pseudomonadota bacterium]
MIPRRHRAGNCRQESGSFTRRQALALIAGAGAYPASLPAAVAGPPQEAFRSTAAHLFGDEQAGALQETFAGALIGSVPNRVVAPARDVAPFDRAQAISPLRYTHEGQRLDLRDYSRRRTVTGLLLARNAEVLFEDYPRGGDATTPFLWASMSKSVIAILVGIALDGGAIRSLDDRASSYVPGLARSAYGDATIRHLLQMSSGVRFEEKYVGDGTGDLARLIGDTIGQQGAGGAETLSRYSARRVQPGAMFYYASADTQALSLVLSAATGASVSRFMQERLWQPMGA